MPQLLGSLFSWFFNKNENEQSEKTYYIKSLLFLTLIILLICNRFHNTTDLICQFLGESLLYRISLIIAVALDFFSIFGIIAAIVWISSFIISIFCDIFNNITNYDYFLRMRSGSKHRFINCMEDIGILLLTALLFDFNTYQQYKNIFSEIVWLAFWILLIIIFATVSIRGIINRFFVLWPRRNKSNNEKILEEFANAMAENKKLREEIEILKANKYSL